MIELLVLDMVFSIKTGNKTKLFRKKLIIISIFISMFQKTTKGIKVSVKTKYNKTRYRGHVKYCSFSYFISIENYSSKTVQLLERFWNIFDSLNSVEKINGKGVIGQTPILKPLEVYNYQSNCFLVSSVGAMSGKYRMIDTSTLEEFFVTIPTFQLIATPRLN